MTRVEKQTTINAPAEKVFNYLADITKHSEWGRPGHKLEVQKTSEGAVGQGSTFRSVGHQFGKNEDAVTVTEYVPNQRVVYESTGNAGLFRHTFELTPSGGGTQLTKIVEPLKPKPPLSFLLPIVATFVLPGAIAGDLQRIKEKVEGS